MSDLSSLFAKAPSMGAFMISEGHGSNMANDQMNRSRLAQQMAMAEEEMGMKKEMHPLEMMLKQLEQQKRQKELPKMDSELEELQMKIAESRQTQPGRIAAVNSKANRGVFDDQDHTNETKRSRIMDAATRLAQMPGPMRGGAFRQMLEAQGADFNNPEVQKLLAMSMQPNFTDQLMQMAQNSVKMDPKHLGQVELRRMQEAGMDRRNDADNKTRYGIQGMQDAAAKDRMKFKSENNKKEALSVVEQLMKSKNYREAATKLHILSQTEPDEAQAAKYAKMAQELANEHLKTAPVPPASIEDGKIVPGQRPTTGLGGGKASRGSGTKEDPIVLD